MTIADPLTAEERAETQAVLQAIRPSLMLAIREFHIFESQKATRITRTRLARLDGVHR